MNITKQQIDELLAVVKIEIVPGDYQSRVDEITRNYQRTANMPGFRPGKVPMGMIKKMYGKAVLVEELNKMLSDSLMKYIYDEKLEVIGSPLPRKSEPEQVFEEGRNFEFSYEVGLAPSFQVKMPKEKIPFFILDVEEKMVEDDIADVRRRYGKFSNPEISEEHHILYGAFSELDEKGELKEGGNKTTTTLSLEMIQDVQKRKAFVGLKKEDSLNFNPFQVLGNEAEVAAMLRVKKEDAALRSDYQFKVMSINQIEKAELNPELFDKVYGEGNVKDEQQFRDKVREGIAAYFVRESDRKLKKDLRLKFLEENQFNLPDDFLKRMLKANQEKEIDEHTFEHEYFHVSEDLRWNLIQNKIAAAAEITVSEDEIKELSRSLIRQQFSQHGYYDVDDQRMDEISKRYLTEDGNYDKLDRSLRESKVFDHLKKEVQLDTIALKHDAFVQKMSEKTEHELEHHH